MEKLLKILWELHPDVDFRSANNLIGEGILDSFDIVSLVSEIDDVFDVKVTAADLIPENFDSAKAIYDLIRRRKQ